MQRKLYRNDAERSVAGSPSPFLLHLQHFFLHVLRKPLSGTASLHFSLEKERKHRSSLIMTSPLTTHVLDTSKGLPAAGLSLQLFRHHDGDPDELLNTAVTDENGRVKNLIESSAWKLGVYRIRFHTQSYFAASQTDCFYPFCDVTFIVKELGSHHHVPLLLNPFGYSTYRGS